MQILLSAHNKAHSNRKVTKILNLTRVFEAA